ncbi:MAG: hypothetical protein ACOC83_00765, partial [Gemmatimonadota bacterium]
STAGVAAGGALLLGALGAGSAAAQQAESETSGDTTDVEASVVDTVAADDSADAAEGSTEGATDPVSYQREVFDYPSLDRRDPFRARTGGVTEGPRFENLVLSGVIYNPSVGSVAVLVDRATGRRHRVREGQRLGQMRIDSIRRSEVELLLPAADGQEARVLSMETRRDEESEG